MRTNKENNNKKINKLLLPFVVMALSLSAFAYGVYAALEQALIINGGILTTISDPSQNAKMAVTAFIADHQNSQFDQYGFKPATANTATFDVKTIELSEENFYLVHKFTFINYGSDIASFDIDVKGANDKFDGNFDYFIGETVDDTIANQAYIVANFLSSGVEEETQKDIFVKIQLKDKITDFGEFTALYQILISYMV